MRNIFLMPVLAIALVLGMSAPSFAYDMEVMEKLKTIEERQEKILQALEEVKSELQIVKVRATNR